MCIEGTEDARRWLGDVAVMVLVLHISASQECCPQVMLCSSPVTLACTCPFFVWAQFVWMLSQVDAPAGQDTSQEVRLSTAASQTQEDLFALLEVPAGP